jgi:hypothetical protein
MRLINTETLKMEEFGLDNAPRYAILSHRWLKPEEELTYQKIQDPEKVDECSLKGYRKVALFCREALRYGYDWGWVDSCCINKDSSTELTEAINSMYPWYRDSAVCYVHLDDFSANEVDLDSAAELRRALSECSWFTRGWTLQELIAPSKVLFFDRDWEYFGSKRGLANIISSITRIDVGLLRNETRLESFSIAQKMSWAAFRQTTRPEDRAYSLLGLFGITLPSVYGEGHEAFYRLQVAIMSRVPDQHTLPDQSLFAWTLEGPKEFPEENALANFNPSSILAPSPDCFFSSSNIVSYPTIISEDPNPNAGPQRREVLDVAGEIPFMMTNMGLQINLVVEVVGEVGSYRMYEAALNCYDKSSSSEQACTICLVQGETSTHARRAEPYYLGRAPREEIVKPDWFIQGFQLRPVWVRPDDAVLDQSKKMRSLVEEWKSNAQSRIEWLRSDNERRIWESEMRARQKEREKSRRRQERKRMENERRQEQERKEKRQRWMLEAVRTGIALLPLLGGRIAGAGLDADLSGAM